MDGDGDQGEYTENNNTQVSVEEEKEAVHVTEVNSEASTGGTLVSNEGDTTELGS